MRESYQEDNFEAAIKYIANYVGTNFYDGSSIYYVFIKLNNTVLDILDSYDEWTATKTQIRIWENEVNINVKKKDRLNTNTGKLLSLIMGQCTEALKAKLRGLSTLQDIKEKIMQ